LTDVQNIDAFALPLSILAMAKQYSFSKTISSWVGGIAVVTCVSLVTACSNFYQTQSQSTTTELATRVTAATKVTALGRLEPLGEVIKLSVINAQDSRVNQMRVEEGDFVETGQVIAILQGLDKKQAELEEAKQNIAVYRAKLAQIEAGEAKAGEIAAQKANIARLEAQLRTEMIERKAEIASAQAELHDAEINYQRYDYLLQEGAETAQNRDNWRKQWEMAQAQLNEEQARLENTLSTLQEQIRQEQATLEKLKEVRSVDRQVAQAEIEHAIAKMKRIEAELDDYYVRVPIAGQILKINTHIGEQVNTTQGIVELGQTNQMYAIAEVYETDVSKVQVGQRATIVSEHGGFEGQVQGTVDHIGLQIQKQDVLEADPAADKDARVVEVKIRIDPEDNSQVAGFTNLQVRVTIELNSTTDNIDVS